MTTQEFSNEFDVLYNNVASNQAPGLDEYEKSVFLTKAQDEVLKAYFNPRLNKTVEGFDGNQKRQYDFSTLVRVSNLYNVNKVATRIEDTAKIDRRSQVFVFPKDYFLSVNEIIFDGKNQFAVTPLIYSEYQRLMLKPYAYPVKKEVWRMFTDKKNCNYFQEYVDNTSCDYNFITTWADQKRNVSLTIKCGQWDESYATEETVVTASSISFKSDNNDYGYVKIEVGAGWNATNTTYNISITVYNSQDDDDESIFEIIKEGFKKASEIIDIKKHTSKVAKVARHLDLFENAEAPSKFTYILDSGNDGKTFTTTIVELPIAEIIGKFSGEVTYQLRYVKKPKPIILADLGDVSIAGINTITECELPSELHEEILQRAVELAKASYAADLNSQIALGVNSQTNLGMVSSGGNNRNS